MGIKSDLASLKVALEATKSNIADSVKCEPLLARSAQIVDRLIANYEAKKKKWTEELAKHNAQVETFQKETEQDFEKLEKQLDEIAETPEPPMPTTEIETVISKSGGIAAADLKKVDLKKVSKAVQIETVKHYKELKKAGKKEKRLKKELKLTPITFDD